MYAHTFKCTNTRTHRRFTLTMDFRSRKSWTLQQLPVVNQLKTLSIKPRRRCAAKHEHTCRARDTHKFTTLANSNTLHPPPYYQAYKDNIKNPEQTLAKWTVTKIAGFTPIVKRSVALVPKPTVCCRTHPPTHTQHPRLRLTTVRARPFKGSLHTRNIRITER